MLLCYYAIIVKLVYTRNVHIIVNSSSNNGSASHARVVQDSSKGGAVETGCSGLHDIISCFTI